MELSENLAASFVAHSGKKSTSGAFPTQEEAAFETVFDMIHSGFMPSYGLSAELSLTPPGENAALDEMIAERQTKLGMTNSLVLRAETQQLFSVFV